MPKNTENISNRIKKNTKWTSDEVAYLKENYSTASWDEIFKNITNHNKDSIIHKASSLKIRKSNFFWSDNDIKILVDNYNPDISIKKLQTY
jgi:hypothetical protein